MTEDRLSGVEMDDGRVIPRDVLFVPPRFAPNNDLLVTLGADVDENGWVRTDSDGATSVPGLWVAGNLANPRAQVITAAGEGSAAAIAMNAVLVDADVRNAVVTSTAAPLSDRPGRRQESTRHPPSNPSPRRTMSNNAAHPHPVGPPTKHQLAVMIWLAVFPTLTVLNLVLGDWLRDLSPIVRTFVLATVAVPIVIYGLMPQLHKVRIGLLSRTSRV